MDNTVKRGRGRPRSIPEDQFTNDGVKGFFRHEVDEMEKLVNGKDDEIIAVDVSEQQANKIARGYFIGNKAIGRRKDVRKVLEERVIGKIGKSGKLLVDKLFELVEGVYMVDKLNMVNGKEEIKYYKVPPNLNAIIYALDRVLGKPKQLSVQANFSLSQLLIKSNDDGGKRTELGRGVAEAIQEESDGVYSGNMES